MSLTAVWFPRHVLQGSGRARWNCSRRRRRSTWRARPCWTGSRSWRTVVIFRSRSWARRARLPGCWGNAGIRRPVRCNRRRRRSCHLLRWRHLVAGHRATNKTGVSLLEKFDAIHYIHLSMYMYTPFRPRNRFNAHGCLTVVRNYRHVYVYLCVGIIYTLPRFIAGQLAIDEIAVSSCPSTFESFLRSFRTDVIL